MNKLELMSSNELRETEGGVIGWVIVGIAVGAASFAGGYGLAYWLG